MTTFEIIEQLKLISEMKETVDEETGVFLYSDEEIKAKYDLINISKEEKLNAIEDYKRSIKKEQELYEDKKKKQESNIKKCKDRAEYLKTLQEALLNGEKLKTDEYNFYYKNSTSYEVIAPESIPDKYFKIEKKPILKDIAAAYKEAVKNGETFMGVKENKKTSLSIR